MGQALRVDGDMTLDPRDLFARVTALLACGIGIFHALRVHDAKACRGRPPIALAFLRHLIFLKPAQAGWDSLTRLAMVDKLTWLPNRNSLHDRLEQALARSLRKGFKVGCLYTDIDHFKQINDTLGHAGGDELLKQFSARMQACIRQTDTFARLAGDEFVAVIEDLDQPNAAQLVAMKIIEAMQSHFNIEGVNRAVTVSIGAAIANCQIDEDDPHSLRRKADAALYCAKREGRNLYRLYETQGELAA